MYLAPEIWMRKTYGFEVRLEPVAPPVLRRLLCNRRLFCPFRRAALGVGSFNSCVCGTGPQVDWWSLGCVLYEMVCGLPPFWGDTIKDVYKKVINSTPKFPAISPDCQSVIEGLLQREPAARLGGRENGAEHPRGFCCPLVCRAGWVTGKNEQR